MLQNGCQIRTTGRVVPAIQHYGVWDGERGLVIHNTSPGGVQYATLRDFANGNVFVEKYAPSGCEHIVVENARALLGHPYSLFSFNCEHFSNLVVKGKRESPQLQRVVGGATFLGVVAWALEWGPFSKTKYDQVAERHRSKRTGRFAHK